MGIDGIEHFFKNDSLSFPVDRKVPLVTYKNGVRKVLGTSGINVDTDGIISVSVDELNNTCVKDLLYGDLSVGFSVDNGKCRQTETSLIQPVITNTVLNQVIRDMVAGYDSYILKMLTATPVGMILCVHFAEENFAASSTSYSINQDVIAHIISYSEECEERVKKTQYERATEVIPDKID